MCVGYSSSSAVAAAAAATGLYRVDSYVWELTGDIDLAPSAGKCGPHWFAWPHLHGLFMILSWGFLLQAGAFIARYFRDYKPPLWFKLHQALQVSHRESQ